MTLAPKPITYTNLFNSLLNDVGHIYDVCTKEDHACFPRLIPGSKRLDIEDIPNIGPFGKPATFICQKGLKLSQGAAAVLISRGIDAYYLEGGIQKWHNEGYPTVCAQSLQQIKGWVCPNTHQAHLMRWLVRRVTGRVDKLIIVDSDSILDVADKFSLNIMNTPMDIFTDLDIPAPRFKRLFEQQAPLSTLLKSATFEQGELIWSIAWKSINEEVDQ